MWWLLSVVIVSVCRRSAFVLIFVCYSIGSDADASTNVVNEVRGVEGCLGRTSVRRPL